MLLLRLIVLESPSILSGCTGELALWKEKKKWVGLKRFKLSKNEWRYSIYFQMLKLGLRHSPRVPSNFSFWAQVCVPQSSYLRRWNFAEPQFFWDLRIFTVWWEMFHSITSIDYFLPVNFWLLLIKSLPYPSDPPPAVRWRCAGVSWFELGVVLTASSPMGESQKNYSVSATIFLSKDIQWDLICI